jgi:hypothetical protein
MSEFARPRKIGAERKGKARGSLAVHIREALERLRAEAREQFIREQEKLEQKELDDRSTVAFARKESMKG